MKIALTESAKKLKYVLFVGAVGHIYTGYKVFTQTIAQCQYMAKCHGRNHLLPSAHPNTILCLITEIVS